jgi:Uracil-DNA glycosylase
MPIGNIYVPDSGSEESSILFVGEAPGAKEVEDRLPFVGESGGILTTVLGRKGVSRDEVRLSNLCHYRPLPTNKFEFLQGSDQLREGQQELEDYIRTHSKLKVIVALGKEPLSFLTQESGISRFRGSILPCVYDPTIKVIPTYHPAYVLRNRSEYPVFDLDIGKAIAETQLPKGEFNYPKYDFVLDPSPVDAELLTQELCQAEKLAVDIETVMNSRHILCVGFAPSAKRAVVFPFNERNIVNIVRILESQAKKILQFGTFDTIQLALNGIRLNNYWWDTLTAQHVLNPELPRGLDTLVSFYTRQPYYKKAGRSEIPSDKKAWGSKVDKNILYEYNGKDCCCTYAVHEGQIEDMSYEPDCVRHTFQFEMEAIQMAIAISMAGMPIDLQRKQELKTVLLKKWANKQYILNTLCQQVVNVRSPALKDILYGKFGLPVKKNRSTGQITTNEDAIVELITYCNSHLATLRTPRAKLDWEVKKTVCKLTLEIRGYRQLLSMYINKDVLDDGRLHSTYKASGPETGRWACEKFVDGTGINAQTMPREAIEIPDDLVAAPEAQVDESQLTAADEVEDSEELVEA